MNNAASRILHTISNKSVQKVGYQGVSLATVITPPPDIKIKIDGVSEEFTKDELVIDESLLEHERQADIEASSTQISGNVNITGAIVVANGSPVQINPATIDISGTKISIKDATLTIKSCLKAGDRVLVAPINNQLHVVLSRVVSL